MIMNTINTFSLCEYVGYALTWGRDSEDFPYFSVEGVHWLTLLARVLTTLLRMGWYY